MSVVVMSFIVECLSSMRTCSAFSKGNGAATATSISHKSPGIRYRTGGDVKSTNRIQGDPKADGQKGGNDLRAQHGKKGANSKP